MNPKIILHFCSATKAKKAPCILKMTRFRKEAKIVIFQFFKAVDEIIFTKLVPAQKNSTHNTLLA